VILQGGLKLHQLTMSMEDAQLLSTRNFQIQEICRIFGVPPHMVGHTEASTSWGSGIEQQSLGFVTYTLQRHTVPFEQELNHKLFKTARLYCEFLTAGLLRGDTKSRFEAYRIALGRAGEPAWMRPSEVRKLENLPADDALDAATEPAHVDTPADPTPDPQPPADPPAGQQESNQ
jgi:HK97 family phage portal protein